MFQLLLLLLLLLHMHGLRERKGNEEMNVNVERNELNGPPNSTPFFGTPVWYLLVTVLSYFYRTNLFRKITIGCSARHNAGVLQLLALSRK